MTADRPSKGRSPARFWIAAGLVLLLAGALLAGRNLLEQYRASRWSSQLLTYVEGQISAPPGDEAEPVASREPIEEENPWAAYEVDGILSIPDLGLRLSVLSHYEGELLSRAIEAITRFDILSEHGIMVCESAADRLLPQVAPPYEQGREYRYGKIKLTVFRRGGSELRR